MASGGRFDSKRQQEQDAADKSAFGMSANDILGERKERIKDLEIWRDNLESLNAYVACGTQWKWVVGATKAIRCGLDYSGVKIVLWGLKVKNPQQVFNDIRAMEAVALEVFNAVK